MHHTKTKGDIGLAKVIADLTVKGYVPCVPLSEHQAYDIVAVGPDRAVFKLQVKYATLKSNGTVEVSVRRSWADRKGSHIRPYSEEEFDYYAVYCPQRDLVLYVANNPLRPISVRFNPSVNCQEKNVNWFHDYLDLPRESSETIRCTPEMAKT